MYSKWQSDVADSGPHAQWDVERLYRTYQQPVLAYLWRLVSNRTVAEDLCQETFVKVLRGWPQRDAAGDVRSWLYRIATNTAYDYLRICRRANRYCVDTQTPEAPAGAHAIEGQLHEREQIRGALEQLPELYRLPLVLFCWAGYSTQEIADALHCPNNTVKARLFRARRLFIQAYSE